MDTYITKEIALDAISYAETLSEAFRLINNQKAADVVEVVRCGQCKYWKRRDNREYGLCVKHNGVWRNSDFCSKGEHKDGGQDE